MSNIAVINLAGAQHLVKAGDKFEVNRLENEEKSTFSPEVLMSTEGEKLMLNAGKVEIEIVEHKKGEKLHIMKFKAKSRYRRRTGHRQHVSVIEVKSVNGDVRETKTATEKVVKAEAKTSVKKATTAKKATKKAVKESK